MNIKEYGRSYANFIANDVDKETEEELMFFRNEFIKDNKENLVVAVEQCITYGSFGGSIILKDFINRSKWLLVDPTFDNILEWENNNPMELEARDNTHCLENLTIATLTLCIHKYLETINYGIERLDNGN